MKISPITNFKVINNQNVSKKQNTFSPFVKNIAADSFSFTGEHIFLDGYMSQINDNKFPDDLYLNLDEVFETFENEEREYHRWENFRFVLADMLAKRCNYIGLTQCAVGSGVGSAPCYSYGYPRKEEIIVSEHDKEENNIIIHFNWTREFHELNDFFEGSRTNPFGAEHDMDKIRKELPEILRKQGWIK